MIHYAQWATLSIRQLGQCIKLQNSLSSLFTCLYTLGSFNELYFALPSSHYRNTQQVLCVAVVPGSCYCSAIIPDYLGQITNLCDNSMHYVIWGAHSWWTNYLQYNTTSLASPIPATAVRRASTKYEVRLYLRALVTLARRSTCYENTWLRYLKSFCPFLKSWNKTAIL
jgi:hypothetical protein